MNLSDLITAAELEQTINAEAPLLRALDARAARLRPLFETAKRCLLENADLRLDMLDEDARAELLVQWILMVVDKAIEQHLNRI